MNEEQATPCADPRHRDFDFWLGTWEVRDPDGNLVGHNRVTRLFDECGLREEWTGAGGLRGTSLNVFAAKRGRWHQTWVDSSGALLLLDGGLRNGARVLEATGGPLRHRISWSRIHGDPDRVRQHWETSADGRTWETAFDGRYLRTTERQPDR